MPDYSTLLEEFEQVNYLVLVDEDSWFNEAAASSQALLPAVPAVDLYFNIELKLMSREARLSIPYLTDKGLLGGGG